MERESMYALWDFPATEAVQAGRAVKEMAKVQCGMSMRVVGFRIDGRGEGGEEAVVLER